ncbi:hypothetical protein [Desulfotomaculum copahuensis]|nr:hypothetical protein [Desulfotomaculum copahuensis]
MRKRKKRSPVGQSSAPDGFSAINKIKPPHLIALLWVLSTGIAGWKYFPMLDDWYWLVKPNIVPNRWSVVMDNYTTRPLGDLLNIGLFSRFWPHLDLLSLLISFIVLAAAAVFYQIARREFHLPVWGFVICLLWWPASVEGQQWLGAATFIAPGMLFLALGLHFIAAYRDGADDARRRLYWLSGFICTTAAFLSYEQFWFCGLAAVVALALRGKDRRWQGAAAGVLALAVTALWYLSMSPGAAAALAARKPPDSISAVLFNLNAVTRQLSEIWGPVTRSAFARPPLIVRSDFDLALLVLLITAFAVWLMAGEYKQSNVQKINPQKIVYLFAAGAAWLVLSYTPWLITSYDYISLRSVYVATPGIGLVVEGVICLVACLVNRLIGNTSLKNLLRTASMAALSFFFCYLVLIHVSEVRSYLIAGCFDTQVGQEITAALGKWGLTKEPVAIRTDKYGYLPWDFYYHEHIISSWASDWAGTDALYALSNGRLHNPIEIIRSDQEAEKLAANKKDKRAWVILTGRGEGTGIRKTFHLAPCLVIRYRAAWPVLEVEDAQTYN